MKVETNGSVGIHFSTIARIDRGGFASSSIAPAIIAPSIGS